MKQSILPGPRGQIVEAIPRFERRRRMRRSALVAVGLFTIVGGVLATSQRPTPVVIGGEPTETTVVEVTPTSQSTAAPTSTTEPTTVSSSQVPVGFDRAAAPDLARLPWNGVTLWTGDEVLLWGGQIDSVENTPAGEPGLAFDPARKTWRELAPGPLEPAYGAAAVWTGTEMIVCCGSGRRASTGSRSAAAYDPAADRWRKIADAPMSSEFVEAVWTGSVMVITSDRAIATYDPSTDVWTVNAEPPANLNGQPLGRLREMVWADTEVIVWPAEVARRVALPLAYDPAADTWRFLPEPPAWPAVPDVVWTGEELVAWGGLPSSSVGSERAVGSIYYPDSNSWSVIPEFLAEPQGCECNLGSQNLLWTGNEVLIFPGNFASGAPGAAIPNAYLLGFDPDTASFRVIGEALEYDFALTMLMAGEQVVFQSDQLYISNEDFGRPTETVWSDRSVDARFTQCVEDVGFESGGVQVLLDIAGVPWWVKSGVDIPAEIFGPCMETIGGRATGLSSYGN